MKINDLTQPRRRGVFAPVARMELSPSLHTFDGARAAEIIAVAVFAEPSALTGELAGVLTGRL